MTSNLGKHFLRNANQKVQVSLTLSESMLCMDKDGETIPKNHRLDVTPVFRQTLGVFSQTAGNYDYTRYHSLRFDIRRKSFVMLQ